MILKQNKAFLALGFSLLLSGEALSIPQHNNYPLIIQDQDIISVVSAKQLNPTTIEVLLSDKNRILIDFYSESIFRLFQDNKGGMPRDPKAEPEAQILVDNPRKSLSALSIEDSGQSFVINSKEIKIEINKSNSQLKVTNTKNNQLVFETNSVFKFSKNKVELKLKENPEEYFFGGGVQNGRFSHKGKAIKIENTNKWTDGGVASPTPFYWSTNGYGFMWYTFKKGKYDFGAKEPGNVLLEHDTDYLDVFFMISDSPVGVLNDFYQLTGNPVLMPKFGFYQGHLNAYNRDYWTLNEKGILFEDGKRYKESQNDKSGIKESLNGEKDNYQFSARAVIDRYQNHDMPLGWLLPNDGYGAGYGQTETLDGNIQNLKELGDYAKSKGVEIGLWTQSDLHPKDSISALLQRDIVKEVRDAGVRVLKTDVAWVGAGYSFGLNGVADVGHIMPYYGNDARPFIISLDGWAGTQRYAGIWSGDQTGGIWEYIRFHIPTYIGSGLSGQPNISSDMDGIFGGKNMFVNVRDFQWKTFTPMELNMDGWGSNEKYPHALGEPATSINRHYLKWKSELMPYAYSIAKEAVDGKPMIRAMFLDYKNPYTLGTSTEYQYLYGPYLLIAPIYKETKVDSLGNDIRDGIYLPEGKWVDYFSGEQYEGNKIVNNFKTPIWKLPVFVKRGAIIPLTNPNNNVSQIDKSHRIYELYPFEKSVFNEYDDDGNTQAYQLGKGTNTCISSELDAKGNLDIHILPTTGDFDEFVKEKSTEFRINTTSKPKSLNAKIGNKKVKLKEVKTKEEYNSGSNVYYYAETNELNQFATKDSEFSKVSIIKNPIVFVKLEKTDVQKNKIEVLLRGYEYNPKNTYLNKEGKVSSPEDATINENGTEAFVLKPSWTKVANADYYEIEFNNMLYSHIQDSTLVFEGLKPETKYAFKIRSVNKDGHSDWKSFDQTTKANPLQHAIKGIVGYANVPSQGSENEGKLFDFDNGTVWHTKYGTKAVPFELLIDLKSYNNIDRIQYVPRNDAGNGTILKGKLSYSEDKVNWKEYGEFKWERSIAAKDILLKDQPRVRYIKIEVSEALGNFGSGQELYVFKVPGSESMYPGDINNDQLVDKNDFTSYMNYTGLRAGDSDFEGYVSNGDINKNGLIDAYDISVVATQLDESLDVNTTKLTGKISISSNKTDYSKNEIVEIKVNGSDIKALNALSFALPYNSNDYEFVGVETQALKGMENLTRDRLHTNGKKALYPTFVNIGNASDVNLTNGELFIIKLKAKRAVKFNLKAIDGILVDKKLETIKF